jgi:very-short-patch-repair endonuclease
MSGRPAAPLSVANLRRAQQRAAAEERRRRFCLLVRHQTLPAPVEEYRFHPERKWRFDYAWPTHRVALEVEGGVFSGGRHSRGAGFRADAEKYNQAAALGWRLLRVLPEQLCTVETMTLLERTLDA